MKKLNEKPFELFGLTSNDYLKWCEDNNKKPDDRKSKKEFFEKVRHYEIRKTKDENVELKKKEINNMQRVILKLYVKGKFFPLVVADIEDDENKIVEELFQKLNSNDKVIKFGNVAFNSADFKRYTLKYK